MTQSPHPEHDPVALTVALPVSGEGAVQPPAVDGPPAAPVPHRRALAALAVLAASAFAYVTAEIAPLGLLGPVSASLGVAESTVGLLITAQAIVVVAGSVPLAIAAKRLRPRTALLVANAVFLVALVVSTTSETFAQLVAGRALSAVAHALFWAVVTPAAAGMFPAAVRGRMVALLLVGGSGAGVIGLPALTWLAQRTSWTAGYWVLAGLAAVLLIALATLMPGFRAEEGSAARGELPSRPMFGRVLASIALAVTAMAITWTYITAFLTSVAGFAAAAVPGLLALGGAVGAITTALVGRFLDRWPVRSAVVGLAALATMFAVLGLGGAAPAITAAMVALQGFAWSVVVPSHLNWAMRHAPGRTDVLIALYQSLFNLGNIIGPIVGGAVLARSGAAPLPLVSAGVSAAALVVVLTVRPWNLLARLRAARPPLSPRGARASSRPPR